MSVRHNLSQLFRIIALLAGLLMIAAATRPTFAQETVIRASFLFPEREPVPVNVLAGQSCLIIFDQPIGRLAVSNTETAEAVVVAPNQMMINGKLSGRSRFTTWAKDGEKFIFFDVDVRSNLAQIDSQVRALFPKEDIRLSQANGSVVISGNVDPKVSTQIESVVQAAGFKTVNLLAQPVQGVLQVQLQLRLAEVSRNKMQELAVSPVIPYGAGQGGYTNTGQGPWSLNRVEEGSMFGSVASTLNLFFMTNNINMFLRALQQQGALRALAEPNLVAMNGQQASFLAGGEIPVPVVQGGGGAGSSVSIVWKEYGIRVNFKPTILDEQHIRLEIEPEVSTLDYPNAVRFEGFLIPALRTRRAKTGIELRDGQSFGIAGLLDNSETRSLAKIPLISSVPILGNLFKSKSFNKNETELVFIVTAKIVEPLNPDALPNMKGIDGLKGASPLGVEGPIATNKSAVGSPAASAAKDAIGIPGAVTSGAVSTPASVAPIAVEDADSNRQPVSSESEKSLDAAPSLPEGAAGSDAKSSPAASESAPAVKGITSPAGKGAAEGETAPPPKPVVIPPQKVITKHPIEGLEWKLRLPPAPAFTALRGQEKN